MCVCVRVRLRVCVCARAACKDARKCQLINNSSSNKNNNTSNNHKRRLKGANEAQEKEKSIDNRMQKCVDILIQVKIKATTAAAKPKSKLLINNIAAAAASAVAVPVAYANEALHVRNCVIFGIEKLVRPKLKVYV